ncbi:hypothetical protein GS434_09825 [Rhodococcus hoagii]|nr:hypothetical protein [Prescottella equi]
MLRTIPLRLPPAPGESLDSWLWAYADRLRATPSELLKALGIPGRAYRDYTVRLFPAEAEDISWAAAVDPQILHSMTLTRYDRRAIVLVDGQRRISRFELMPRVTGTRYCHKCLKETGGRWQLSWRLSWSFVCLKHRCLLADRCPVCGAVPHSYRGIGSAVPPQQCNARISGEPRRVRCRADLSCAKTPTLRVGSRVLAAQLWINDLIEAQEPGDAAARAILADLATVSGRILAQARPESVRQCGARFAAALTEARTTGRIKRLRGLFPEQDAVLAARRSHRCGGGRRCCRRRATNALPPQSRQSRPRYPLGNHTPGIRRRLELRHRQAPVSGHRYLRRHHRARRCPTPACLFTHSPPPNTVRNRCSATPQDSRTVLAKDLADAQPRDHLRDISGSSERRATATRQSRT